MTLAIFVGVVGGGGLGLLYHIASTLNLILAELRKRP